MNAAAERVVELNKVGVIQAEKAARIGIEKAEHLAKLNIESAKAAIAETVITADAVSSVKDFQELVVLGNKLAKTTVEYALGYSRNIYEVASQAQSDFARLAEEAKAAYTHAFTAWLETVAKDVPGADLTVKGLKSTVETSTAALDKFGKTTKEVAQVVDTQIRASSEKFAEAVDPEPAKGRKAG
jgi:phasin family protein